MARVKIVARIRPDVVVRLLDLALIGRYLLAEPAVDHRQLVPGAGFGLAVLDQVLVEQDERDDLGDAGHDDKQQPDDGVTEVAGHLAQHRQVTGGPLEGRGHFLLQALPPGPFPRHGGGRVQELEPPGR